LVTCSFKVENVDDTDDNLEGDESGGNDSASTSHGSPALSDMEDQPGRILNVEDSRRESNSDPCPTDNESNDADNDESSSEGESMSESLHSDDSDHDESDSSGEEDNLNYVR